MNRELSLRKQQTGVCVRTLLNTGRECVCICKCAHTRITDGDVLCVHRQQDRQFICAAFALSPTKRAEDMMINCTAAAATYHSAELLSENQMKQTRTHTGAPPMATPIA
jgi:hypothetical protein